MEVFLRMYVNISRKALKYRRHTITKFYGIIVQVQFSTENENIVFSIEYSATKHFILRALGFEH